MDSLTRDEVRAVDAAAIQGLGIPGLILMENAGRNCADAIEEFIGSENERKVAIVAGPGNNGGDGYVIARHLAMRGFEVVTFIICPIEKISGGAEVNLRAISVLRHDIRFPTSQELSGLSASLGEFDVVIDAVGGTGISGALRGGAAMAVEQINAAGRPVVAVDIPTGLDCDTGRADGPAVRADLTVTFVAPKVGFDVDGAQEFTGKVVVADIGVPAELVRAISAEFDK
ncbi:MAG: NAD(P)H-hydrate epimerase [Phycisphaerae bacterium]|jgi:NAD(P)H-hydrate epimerase|nr:NAD(P)H-hydrate epimerase [Phycisphaerae bacterium]